MISKELLSEVMKIKIGTYFFDGIETEEKLWLDDTGSTSYICWNKMSETYDINIYELAHKCKEWAFNIDTTMINSSVTEALMGIASIKDDNGTILFCEVCDTEPEAIFKACQWILDNKYKQ